MSADILQTRRFHTVFFGRNQALSGFALTRSEGFLDGRQDIFDLLAEKDRYQGTCAAEKESDMVSE